MNFKKKITILFFLCCMFYLLPHQILFTADFKKQNAEAINFLLFSPDYSKKIILFKELDKIQDNELLLLNFTSYTCKPCKKEIPELEKLVSKYKKVTLWIIYTDNNIEEIKRSILSIGVKSIVLVDVLGATAKKYGVSSIPTTYIISKNKKIMSKATGFSPETICEIENSIKGLGDNHE